MILIAATSIVGAVIARQLTVSSTRNVFVDVGIILGVTGVGFVTGVALSTLLSQ